MVMWLTAASLMLGLGAYGNLGTDGVLEVGIELLFQIQFRTVTGQVEKLYLVLAP